jgi:tetratricopeptide (TPR) repeat protein
MKKFAFILSILIFISVAYTQAQNSKVVSAYNYKNSGKLDKAKTAIDGAVAHEKTMADPKAWFYRGNIYLDIYRSEEYKNLDPDALNVAYTSYQKALELDEKKKYTDDIIKFMPVLGEAYYNEGANKYNVGMTNMETDTVLAKESFKKSVEAFENAYKIYSESGINDTATIYYISVAAELGKDYPKAKSNLEKLVAMNYQEPSIYTSLANIYFNQDKDVEKALATYKKGREAFPSDLNMLLNETNIFLAEGMTEQALENLKMAAQIDESNPTIFFAIGAKYNEVVDDTTRTQEMRDDSFLKAIEAYDKAIALKPDYFDPNYNMGALYVNKASSIIEVANTLPFEEQEKYDKMKTEADDYLNKSLPYLESAHALDPEDMSTMVSLKEIYIRLKMNDKLQEINTKLGH